MIGISTCGRLYTGMMDKDGAKGWGIQYRGGTNIYIGYWKDSDSPVGKYFYCEKNGETWNI